ncbi:MAG: radical SAM protein [Kiritimatiellia bacterium]|nr:radical SAM protein [Kiritimatiellia bacterium]
MRVMVINPPRVDRCTVVREERFEHRDVGSCYPPLSHLHVAGALEAAGHDVRLLDANGLDLSLEDVRRHMDEFRPEAVFARVAFDCQREDTQLLRYARETHGAITLTRCKIIAEADFVLEAFLREFAFLDLFFLAEPDAVIVAALAALREGRPKSEIPGVAWLADGAIRRTALPEPESDLDRLPRPAWHLLPSLSPYHTGVLEAPFAVVQTTRGCPFGCAFCAYRRNRIRYHSPKRVVEELRMLKDKFGLRSFLLFDDVVGLDEQRFMRILDGIIEARLDLQWACCTRANLLTRDAARRMKEAGCVEVAVGIESGDPEVLERTGKKITLDQVREASKICRENGLLFYAMCIIGLPGETRESVKRTCRFLRDIRPFYTQVCFSTPLPNTPNFAWYKENSYLLTEDWSRYSSLYPHPVVRTEALSADDLSELRRWIYRRMLLRPGWWLSQIRPFDWRWNLRGARKLAGRILALARKDAVR